MGRILTLLGVVITVYSAKLTWASIDLVGLHQNFNGFSKDPLFANMPGLITAIMGLLALIMGLINRRIPQMGAMVIGIAMLGWGLYQYYDKAKYFATQDGFELSTGIYLHAFAPLLIILGAIITLKRVKR